MPPITRLLRGICLQVVQADGMVKDGAKLIVYGSEVGLRITFAVFVAVVDHDILPLDDIRCSNFTHRF